MLNQLKNRLAPSGRALQVAKDFKIPLDVFATTGERDAILASSGMGKSYLTGVLMEETLETGTILCVVDPEGEHFTLAERYPMMIIGGEHGNLPLEEDAIEIYVDAMLSQGISAVFDVSDYIDIEQTHYYALVAEKLFNAEQKYRRKVRLVVEEAQIFAPQRSAMGGNTKSKYKDPVMASQKIAKRGRKRAIDSLWATQRPASISKDILSQCNRFWFGGITSEQDYKAIKPFLNEAGISFAQIKALNPGEFYFFAKGKTRPIKVRKRYCKHAGATPEAGMKFSAVSNGSLNSAIMKLEEAVGRFALEKKKEEAEIAKYKQAIRELEEENRKLREELETERLASKVIERLGAMPTESQERAAKPRRRKSGYDKIDEIESTIRELTPGPEKIVLDS